RRCRCHAGRRRSGRDLMSRRRVLPADPVDRTYLPLDEWRLVESRPHQDLGLMETLFTTANGYLGMRGTPEEGRDAESHGTFLNGFHETWTINHAESAFGFARTGQTMISVPDSSVIKLYVDDEPLLLSIADLEEYERWIDFREGVLRRELIWRTPAGKRVRVTTSRMVSFPQRHLALMSLQVEMLDGSAPIAVSSQIINREDFRDDFGAGVDGSPITDKADPRQTTDFTHRVLEPLQDWHSERRMLLGYRVARSARTIRWTPMPRSSSSWTPARTWAARWSAPIWRRASPSPSARRWPTTPPAPCPIESCSTAAAARSTGCVARASRPSTSSSVSTSRTSGAARTSSCPASPRPSRPPAGACSSWRRPRPARTSGASPPRA